MNKEGIQLIKEITDKFLTSLESTKDINRVKDFVFGQINVVIENNGNVKKNHLGFFEPITASGGTSRRLKHRSRSRRRR